MPKFNLNHWAALIFSIVGWVLGWYSIVLINVKYSNDTFPVNPTKHQWYGAGFAVGLATLSWIRYFYTLQEESEYTPP